MSRWQVEITRTVKRTATVEVVADDVVEASQRARILGDALPPEAWDESDVFRESLRGKPMTDA